jgi:hypothetical protein
MAEVSAVHAHRSAIIHGQEISPLEFHGARRASPRLARRDYQQLGRGRLSHIHILHRRSPPQDSTIGCRHGPRCPHHSAYALEQTPVDRIR